MADAKKLSSMDASFLYLETPEMPMHVGSMAIFRLPENYNGNFFEDFKAMIASRLHLAPILKARLEKAPLDIDHPSWVEDDQFDIDRHIFRGSLPAPYDRATLERIVGWMHAKLLNRARPLWEFYVFEGMKDNEIGLYSKMHHACIDGGAGAALTNMIYDMTPVPREVEPPTAREGRAGAARHRRQPDRFLSAALAPAVRRLVGAEEPRAAALGQERSRIDPVRQRHVPDRERGEIRRQRADDAQERFRSGRQDFRSEVARQHRQHGVAADHSEQGDLVGAQLCRHLDLAVAGQGGREGVRRQAQRRGAGALLRRGPALSAEQGALPTKSLTAAVPISLREEGNTDANNQVFGMICSIATNIEDPKERLEAIIAQSTKSKEMSHPLRALMPQVSNISMLGAPIVVQILALLYSRSNLSDVLPPAANITVSNVPGPRQTLYAAGAELLHIFPVSISTHGLALNITVQSYRDQLDFGFIAGANIIPHVQVLCDMLPLEFEALEAALRRRRRA